MGQSRAKGNRYEREFAEKVGGEKISRTGYAGPDVRGADGTLYEVKYRNKLPLWFEAWIEQMLAEGADALAFRRKRGKWMILRLLDETE